MEPTNILKKIAAEKGLFLSERDPIFAAMILNKLILEEYSREIQDNLSACILDLEGKEKASIKKFEEVLTTQQNIYTDELNRIVDRFSSEIKNLQIYPQRYEEHSKEKNFPLWVMIAFALGLVAGGAIMRIFV